MKGIDVSQWQGYIDFEAVRQAKIVLVYMKATEGIDFVDPFFYRNYAGARNAGLPVGFYHYLTARSASAARQEAYHFVTAVNGLIPAGKMVMDIEDLSGLTKMEINEIARAFLQGVEEFSNKTPAIYADAGNAANVLEEDLAVYPLWIAQYGVETPDTNNPWGTWAGWQYTDLGRVAGIQGNVDRDIFTEEILEETVNPVIRQGERPAFGYTDIAYTVQPGDTLGEIAEKYHVSVAELQTQNQISQPDFLLPGEILNIRIWDDRKQADTYLLYRVRSGDTLYAIASRYGTTAEQLAKVNGIINPSLIYAGQVIKIPRIWLT